MLQRKIDLRFQTISVAFRGSQQWKRLRTTGSEGVNIFSLFSIQERSRGVSSSSLPGPNIPALRPNMGILYFKTKAKPFLCSSSLKWAQNPNLIDISPPPHLREILATPLSVSKLHVTVTNYSLLWLTMCKLETGAKLSFHNRFSATCCKLIILNFIFPLFSVFSLI